MPAVSCVSVTAAIPLAMVTGIPICVPLSKNVAVPVSVPAVWDVIAAVNFTLSPTFDGFSDEVMLMLT